MKREVHKIKETYYTLIVPDNNREEYKNITGDEIDEVLKGYIYEKSCLEENNKYGERLLMVLKIIHLLTRLKRYHDEYNVLTEKLNKTKFEL